MNKQNNQTFIDIDESEEQKEINKPKEIKQQIKSNEEKKAKLQNTEEKIEKMIKTINRLISTHIKEMKKAKEQILEVIQNGLNETDRGIISQETTPQSMKSRMEKINLLTKSFDTSTLEKEFNGTKDHYG